ncbi:unnamed protein product [Withania somnifera]
MAVYFKYKSALHYDSIPIVHPFISVANLKLSIFLSKRYGKGKDFDILITNSQTNRDYVDQDTLIPKNTSVLIRRVPGLPCLPVVIPPLTEPSQVSNEIEEAHSVKTDSLDFDCDDFGDDVYVIPKILPIQPGNPVVSRPPTSSINDEDTKIKNLIDTPVFRQSSNGYGFGRGGMERKKPSSGYVCHRCNVPGHFIQHCPTNGDPNYDIKKVKQPTESMLRSAPSGSAGVLKPNEAESSKEVGGLSSSSSSSIRSFLKDVPPELHCPLCKGLMKDAVISSKCCFSSFCDKCIRNHIISNSICVCGAKNILVDALLPNITLRITINRILESSSSSSEYGVSTPLVQDMVSAHSSVEVLKTSEECPLAVELQKKPTSGEAVQTKKRKKPYDVDAVNMQYGVAQDHVVAESYMNPTAYHPYCTGTHYMGYGHHVLPRESFRGQYVETRRGKREMSVEVSSVITC